jgi:hypothetical protein
MDITGRIKLITDTQEFGSNGFKKREIVITTDEQYPQHIIIEFVQDKTTLLDAFQVGQDVKIAFNLRGREWINPEGIAKYFNSLSGWRIEAAQSSTPPPMAPPQNLEQVDNTTDTNEPDDLPF